MAGKILSFFLLALLLAMQMGCVSANWRAVFVANSAPLSETARFVAFVDGDCYARMSRVQRLAAQPWQTLRRHDFENFPVGTRPHTTLPLDWLILALALPMRLLAKNGEALDLAGAWVSPMLGACTLIFLWFWSGHERIRFRWVMLGFVAANPMLAHGFALGRPDHQSLEIFCLAVALAAEISLGRKPRRGWGYLAGAAWGLALWTSLYEPAVLFAATVLSGALLGGSEFWRRERLFGWALGGGIMLLALAFEGVRLELPGAEETGNLFAAWSRQIGELGSLAPWSPALFHWTGWLLPVAPILLVLVGRKEKVSLVLALELTLLWGLTCWQVRWAYFLALVLALSLPWQFRALLSEIHARWVVVLALAVWIFSLWPMLRECRQRLVTFRNGSAGNVAAEREAASLREVADFLRRENPSRSPHDGLLAPWWESPALTYWSGLPAVAGSSHESLPGNADAARFFLLPARDFAGARALLSARQVRWVVVDDPTRVLPLAADLLRLPLSRLNEPALGEILASDPLGAPPFLRLAFANPELKVYAVTETLSADPTLVPSQP